MQESYPADNRTVRPSEMEGVYLDKQDILNGRASIVSSIEQIGEPVAFVDMNGNVTERLDRFMRVRIEGFGYGIRETSPADPGSTGVNIVRFPGFTERIEHGSAYNFHNSLATEMPNSRIVSVSSDGIGTTGENIAISDFLGHGMTEMGEARAKLLEALFGDEPTIVSACSMGTVIEHHMKVFDAKNGHNLNIVSAEYAAAKVVPKAAFMIMGVLFPIAMLADTPREIIRTGIKYGPDHLMTMLPMIHEREPESVALVRQVISLVGGVSMKSMIEIAREYPGGISIGGAMDPLKRPSQQRIIKEVDPDFHVATLRFKGHGIAADGFGGGIKTGHEIKKHKLEERMLAA